MVSFKSCDFPAVPSPGHVALLIFMEEMVQQRTTIFLSDESDPAPYGTIDNPSWYNACRQRRYLLLKVVENYWLSIPLTEVSWN